MIPRPRLDAARERAAIAEDRARAISKEYQRVFAERDAAERLLRQAEATVRALQGRPGAATEIRRLRTESAIRGDVIAALEERLLAAEKANAYCDRHHRRYEREASGGQV